MLFRSLLSLFVTYRQLIMPLVRAVETRMGHDAQLHAQIEHVEKELERLENKRG